MPRTEENREMGKRMGRHEIVLRRSFEGECPQKGAGGEESTGILIMGRVFETRFSAWSERGKSTTFMPSERSRLSITGLGLFGCS